MNLIDTPVFRVNKWQDTTQGPNLLILHLGPGLISPSLQFDSDVSNQSYHKDSMSGQVTDPTNALVVHPGPPVNTITIVGATVDHRDSMKGQLPDPVNLISLLTLNVNPGQPGALVINPVFTKSFVQDTTVPQNLVLNLLNVGSKPFVSQLQDDQVRKRNVLSGQFLHITCYLPQPEPIVQNEQFTFVSRAKTAQEPFVFPNVIIQGIAAIAPPFVQRQTEDYTYKVKEAQAPFDFPNVVAYNLKPTSPFVQSTFPDLQFRGKLTQETYDFPNVVIRGIVPNQAPQIIVAQVYESLQWRGAKTQEHFDYPNLLAITIPIPPPPPFRVKAVQPGTYDGIYREIGDVFDLIASADYSAYNVNYGPASGTQQFGWMIQVPQTTPLFTAALVQNPTLRPVSDPIPPVRYVY